MDRQHSGPDRGLGRPWRLDAWSSVVSEPVPHPLLLLGRLRAAVETVAWPNGDPLGPSSP
jgi:hypothetical protein